MAALREQFAHDRNLNQFMVQAIPTGRHLGAGSYGAVEEVEVYGIVCAAKKIYDILLDLDNDGVENIVERYLQECRMMSGLRHPNITQFIGVFLHQEAEQLPWLIMEKLDGSLDELLEAVPNIPLILKRSMLEDIARGLHYLHTHNPQIIHRDLTAKNVLLTSSLVAKITDLGNSRIVNIQPGQLAQTLSRNPGTLVYMPPEALTDRGAQYGPSLDIFSFGHLGLFVGLQIFPGNLLEPTYMDPEDPHRLAARTEVERRREYIQNLEDLLPTGERHPFVLLVKRCLHNDPAQRPTSEELITALEEIKAIIEGIYGSVTKIDAVRQVLTIRALRKSDAEVRERTDQLAGRDQRINELQQDLEREQADRIRAEEHLQQVTTESRIHLEQRDTQIRQQQAQLQEKDIRIHHIVAELGQARTVLQQKDTQLNQVRQIVEHLCTDLEEREVQLRAQEEAMKERDSEINRLSEELRRCHAQLR